MATNPSTMRSERKMKACNARGDQYPTILSMASRQLVPQGLLQITFYGPVSNKGLAWCRYLQHHSNMSTTGQ